MNLLLDHIASVSDSFQLKPQLSFFYAHIHCYISILYKCSLVVKLVMSDQQRHNCQYHDISDYSKWPDSDAIDR